MSAGGEGHVREKLRLFWRVVLDTSSYEDALWAVLEADRRERGDEWPAARLGPPRARDGKQLGARSALVRAVLELAADLAGVTPGELRQRGWERRTAAARRVAMRALRDSGYSYRAIGRAVGRASGTVRVGLGRLAGSRDLAEEAERVLRRARRRASRM